MLILPLESECSTVCSWFSTQTLDHELVARIYTFPVNIMLTEFSKQLISRSIEVTWKLFSPVFLASANFQSFFCFANFKGFSGGNFNMFESFGKGQDCLLNIILVI